LNGKENVIQNNNNHKEELFLYVLITYSITWTILFPLILYYNTLDKVTKELWHSFGAFGPAIAGIIIIYREKGKEGLLQLKTRLIKSAGFGLILFSLSPIIILIFSVFFEFLIGLFNINQFIQMNQIGNIGSVLIFILPSLSYGFFEEIGWRGYLLPALQQKNNAFTSSLILAVIWWFWHFPTFFYRFDIVFAIVLMFPLMVFGSITFTFLFNQSNGSLLMLIIFHICYDLTTSHQISIIATILTSVLFVFVSIRAIKINGKETLSKRKVII